MEKVIAVVLTAILFLTVGGISYSNDLDFENRANTFVNLLAKGDFNEAEKFFSETVANALPTDALESAWGSITATLGKFNSILETKVTEYGEYKIVIVTCNFELGTLGIQITFDKEAQIVGLYFLPPQFKATYVPPSYANPNTFTEIELIVETGDWKLSAILTLPQKDKPCPAVVLVHGSGPQDRDETIGPNKPFKDLAWGLASRGIAVLRYEKRTKQYGGKSLKEGFTVNEETIEDAISAVELLLQRKEIDESKIFLLGHSLGGMLAPRIVMNTGRLKGIIMLAGTIRDLLDLIARQTKYLASLDDKIDEKEAKQIEDVENEVNIIRSLKIEKNENILGAPGSYWLDLMNYNPLETAKKLNIPILILQGDRDYQVTVEDFKGWQEGLKSKDKVTFKLYRGLNHLFMHGDGKPNPDEYYKVGNVSQEVIEDIAEWIRK